MGILSIPPSSEALAWDPRPELAPRTASMPSCGAPMLGHVWDLTLRACHSVIVAGKTLIPGPKFSTP